MAGKNELKRSNENGSINVNAGREKKKHCVMMSVSMLPTG